MTRGIAIDIQKVSSMCYRCNKCNSDIKEGFLLEKGDGGVLSSGRWVSGNSEKSFLFGVILKDKAVYGVKTFRCIACGYLLHLGCGNSQCSHEHWQQVIHHRVDVDWEVFRSGLSVTSQRPTLAVKPEVQHAKWWYIDFPEGCEWSFQNMQHRRPCHSRVGNSHHMPG